MPGERKITEAKWLNISTIKACSPWATREAKTWPARMQGFRPEKEPDSSGLMSFLWFPSHLPPWVAKGTMKASYLLLEVLKYNFYLYSSPLSILLLISLDVFVPKVKPPLKSSLLYDRCSARRRDINMKYTSAHKHMHKTTTMWSHTNTHTYGLACLHKHTRTHNHRYTHIQPLRNVQSKRTVRIQNNC